MRLNLVYPNDLNGDSQTDRSLVEVQLDRSKSTAAPHLLARFTVQSGVPIFQNSDLDCHSSQWGIWEWDVVELFVKGAEDFYCEFVVSPLGQYFELKIKKPRVDFDRSFQSGFKVNVKQLSESSWLAQMEIPLQALGVKTSWDHLSGNAFAILGPSHARRYYSSFLPLQDRPDFHLPEYFKSLTTQTAAQD